jgi:hypothetical protein
MKSYICHLFFALLLLSSCSAEAANGNVKSDSNSDATVDESQKLRESKVERADTLVFAFAGDIMQGTNYPETPVGAYLPKNDGANLFDDVKEILQQADLAAANNEGVLMNSGGNVKKCSNPTLCYAFRTPIKYVNNLVDAGIDFMSVANNHINDFGDAGLSSTMQTLKDAGIAYAGLKGKCETAIIERKGKKIGFAAFGHNKGTLNIMNYDEVKRVVSGLDSVCDMVVVSFHGGGEGAKFTHVPHAMEYCFGENRGDVEKFAHTAIDAGADIVYGHGPHVTRGLDLYKDRLIIYSLGNFCTPYRVSLSGVNAHAPIVTVRTTSTGEFLDGKIHSFIQVKGEGPKIDKSGSVARNMKNLSESDFKDSHLYVSESGELSVRK